MRIDAPRLSGDASAGTARATTLSLPATLNCRRPRSRRGVAIDNFSDALRIPRTCCQSNANSSPPRGPVHRKAALSKRAISTWSLGRPRPTTT